MFGPPATSSCRGIKFAWRFPATATSTHYDRNPNTGHPFGVDAAMQPASQTVYHDEEHASVLTLPIMPEPMKPLAAN